jgi:hypothetical protein
MSTISNPISKKPSKGFPIYVESIHIAVDLDKLKQKYLKNKKRD